MIKDKLKTMVNFLKVHYEKLIMHIETWEDTLDIIKVVLIITVSMIFAKLGMYLNTGLGKVVELIVFTIIGLITLKLSIILVKVLLKILRDLPKRITSLVLATIILLTIVIQNSLYLVTWQAIICATSIVIVETILALCLGRIKQKGVKSNKILILLFITVGLNIYWGIWIFTSIDLNFNNSYEVNRYNEPQQFVKEDLSLSNSLKKGKYSVETLTYGSGSDKRLEFGKNAKLIAGTINVTSMLGRIDGFRGKMRNLFWGFSEKEYPLNGTVWYPKEQGKFPLVLIVHGNHAMEDYSDKGYEYLGQLLASQGFIAASVDENFLNGSWSGDMGNENDVRAWLLLKHLEVWQRWSESTDNVFYGKVDMTNIALVGHSRGGEAVATAAAFNNLAFYPNDADITFNFHFNIKSVVAIAPTDGQYKPAGKLTPLENINYLVLQGAQDSDVSSFYGDLQYNRVKFTDGKYHFKTSLYIEGANHGQFNSTWGNKDLSGPSELFLNTKTMLKGEEQRSIAKLYISAFLQNTLYNKDEYMPIFKNYNYVENLLPKTTYVSKFQDSNYKTIADFEEDIDITTGAVTGAVLKGEGFSLWRERAMMLRSEEEKNNSAVVLKWENVDKNGKKLKSDDAKYIIKLPKNFAKKEFHNNTSFNFSLGDTGSIPENMNNSEKYIDLTIQIKDKNGLIAETALSKFGNLNAAIDVKFTKWGFLEKQYDNEVEINLQSFQIPMAEFIKVNPKIQPENIEYINFIFNKTLKGEVLLDNIGYED